MLGCLYWVSRCGHVFSISSNGSIRKTPKKLKPRKQKNGYLTIRFKGKNVLKHRVIASAFLGGIENKIVHHKNGIRDDNRACNLMITDYSANNRLGNDERTKRRNLLEDLLRQYSIGKS